MMVKQPAPHAPVFGNRQGLLAFCGRSASLYSRASAITTKITDGTFTELVGGELKDGQDVKQGDVLAEIDEAARAFEFAAAYRDGALKTVITMP